MTVHKDEVRTAQWSMVQNGQRAWVMGEGVAIRTTASSRGTTSSPPVAFSRRSVAIFLSFGERNIHAAHSTALCWCIFAQALWLHSAGPGAAHVAASRWPRHDRDLLAQWFCQLWLLIHAVECVSARELHGWSRTHHHSCNKRHIDRNFNRIEIVKRRQRTRCCRVVPTADCRRAFSILFRALATLIPTSTPSTVLSRRRACWASIVHRCIQPDSVGVVEVGRSRTRSIARSQHTGHPTERRQRSTPTWSIDGRCLQP
jgi:hypothetical protein